MSKYKIIFISALLSVILIIVLLFIFTKDGRITSTKSEKIINQNLLTGNWVRTDYTYLIRVSKVNNDGTLDAKYFNPNPINVESAGWEETYGNLKITVVLKDINYPGSKYTLNYLPDRDMLAGDYYQAVEGINFYVEFVRSK